MKKYLATFYSPDLKKSDERFKTQSESMEVYDKIFTFSKHDLNDDFKNYVETLIKNGKHNGYGHWVWQTYIHQLVLSKMEKDDIYHWCDVGCHFNKLGVKRLKEYFDIVSNDEKGFLGFSYQSPPFKKDFENYIFPKYCEYEYTKSDLIKYFGIDNNDNILKTPQLWGGSFFIKKKKISLEIMKAHYEITRNRYDLIDDDKSKFVEKSLPGFISHRHSQSVLSILTKQNNCKFLSAYESEWAFDENNQRTYKHLNSFPIIAKRDKKKNIFMRFVDRQKKNYSRYKRLIFN